MEISKVTLYLEYGLALKIIRLIQTVIMVLRVSALRPRSGALTIYDCMRSSLRKGVLEGRLV